MYLKIKTTYLYLTNIASLGYSERKVGASTNSVHTNKLSGITVFRSFINLKELLHLSICVHECVKVRAQLARNSALHPARGS